MSRLSSLTEADLNPEQRAVLEAIAAGPRGSKGMEGPFGVFARVPEVGHEVQALGAAVRYKTGLAESVKEVAICTVGAFFQSRFEFAAHAALAKAAGVADAAVEDLRLGATPAFTDEGERIAHVITSELLARHRISDPLYAEGKAALGEDGMIELVATIGYYCLVSLTLNTFQVPLREGMTDPFPDVVG